MPPKKNRKEPAGPGQAAAGQQKAASSLEPGAAAPPPPAEHKVEEQPSTDAERPGEQSKRHDNKGAADLEKVTDYFEEKELSGAASLSSVGIEQAMKALAEKSAKEREAKVAHDRALRKVAINKDHVDLIMREMEMGRAEAERALREHEGDAVRTLITLVNG